MRESNAVYRVWKAGREDSAAPAGYGRKTAAWTAKEAHRRYRKLVGGLPEFEKEDRFRVNILSCAMLAAFVLNMPRRPDVDELTEYYAAAMMTEPMKWFCRQAGKQKFSSEDIEGMKETAALRAADRNPYSWNMEFLPYPDGRRPAALRRGAVDGDAVPRLLL